MIRNKSAKIEELIELFHFAKVGNSPLAIQFFQ